MEIELSIVRCSLQREQKNEGFHVLSWIHYPLMLDVWLSTCSFVSLFVDRYEFESGIIRRFERRTIQTTAECVTEINFRVNNVNTLLFHEITNMIIHLNTKISARDHGKSKLQEQFAQNSYYFHLKASFLRTSLNAVRCNSLVDWVAYWEFAGESNHSAKHGFFEQRTNWYQLLSACGCGLRRIRNSSDVSHRSFRRSIITEESDIRSIVDSKSPKSQT